jgi:DNA-binding HxlR family transcriptional regulator
MPLSMRPTITCKKCNGAGAVPMPRELERTLRAVVAGYDTTDKMHQQDQDRATIGRAAMNARLEDLMAEGLVTRRKGPGKYFIYTATAKGRRLTPAKRKPTSNGSAKTRQR